MHISGLNPLRPLALVGLLALLLTLGACSQRPTESGSSDKVADSVAVHIMALPSQVTKVTLSLDGGEAQSATVSGGTASLTLKDVAFGSHTLVARGLSGANVVLYKGSQSVTVDADTTSVDMKMDRLTGNVRITASNLGPASEVLIAKVGGLEQRLVLNGSTATGTVVGVATGSDLSLQVDGFEGGTHTRQGSTSFTLSEGGADVTVTLNAVTTPAPATPTLTHAPQVEVDATFSLGVSVTDANSDLRSLKIAWGDDSTETFDIGGGSVNRSYTHSYSVSGDNTFVVTVKDAAGNQTSASGTVTVTAKPAPDTDTDVDVVIDTGKDLSKVTLQATNVPSTGGVQVAVTPQGGAQSTVVNLVSRGSGTWSASLMMSRASSYSLVYTAQGKPSSASVTCTVPSAETHTCTYAFSGGAPTPSNTAPVANADERTTNQNKTITIDVLANDTDADNDTLTLTGVSTPALGSAKIEGGKIVYTAPASFNVVDTFTYTVSDGTATVTGSVKVNIAFGVGIGG